MADYTLVDTQPIVPGPWGPAQLLVPLRPGGFGDVYIARLDGDDGLVVLKRLEPSLALDVGDVLASVRRLQGLPLRGVVEVRGAGVFDGFGWVATGFIEGIDLQTWREQGPRPGDDDDAVSLAVGIAHGILDGLEALHGAGLVHRDVSPANVVVGSDGAITVIDVDLVVPVAVAATESVPGTPSCMSPEQAQGLPVDGRADLLGWGIVVTELLTGESFYGDLDATTVWRLARTGGSRPAGFGALPAPLQAVVQRAGA